MALLRQLVLTLLLVSVHGQLRYGIRYRDPSEVGKVKTERQRRNQKADVHRRIHCDLAATNTKGKSKSGQGKAGGKGKSGSGKAGKSKTDNADRHLEETCDDDYYFGGSALKGKSAGGKSSVGNASQSKGGKLSGSKGGKSSGSKTGGSPPENPLEDYDDYYFEDDIISEPLGPSNEDAPISNVTAPDSEPLGTNATNIFTTDDTVDPACFMSISNDGVSGCVTAGDGGGENEPLITDDGVDGFDTPSNDPE